MLGLYLTDLTFVEELPSRVDGLINFAKRRKTAQILMELKEFQKYPFPLQPIPVIQYYLKNLPAYETSVLWDLSLAREPRAASVSITAASTTATAEPATTATTDSSGVDNEACTATASEVLDLTSTEEPAEDNLQ